LLESELLWLSYAKIQQEFSKHSLHSRKTNPNPQLIPAAEIADSCHVKCICSALIHYRMSKLVLIE
jgi:hypothetical protein